MLVWKLFNAAVAPTLLNFEQVVSQKMYGSTHPSREFPSTYYTYGRLRVALQPSRGSEIVQNLSDEELAEPKLQV